MREDHEELVLRNPAFCAVAFWHLARSFADHADGKAPSLPFFAVGAGMLFHAITVAKLSGMRFESGLLKAVSDCPDITAGLQSRVEQHLREGLVALQAGSASGLLRREEEGGLPAFRAIGTDLPIFLRTGGPHTSPTLAASRRLGAWFAIEGLHGIQHRLAVRF